MPELIQLTVKATVPTVQFGNQGYEFVWVLAPDEDPRAATDHAEAFLRDHIATVRSWDTLPAVGVDNLPTRQVERPAPTPRPVQQQPPVQQQAPQQQAPQQQGGERRGDILTLKQENWILGGLMERHGLDVFGMQAWCQSEYNGASIQDLSMAEATSFITYLLDKNTRPPQHIREGRTDQEDH